MNETSQINGSYELDKEKWLLKNGTVNEVEPVISSDNCDYHQRVRKAAENPLSENQIKIQSALFKAIRKNDLRTAENAIMAGADVNAVCGPKSLNTLLQSSVFKNTSKMPSASEVDDLANKNAMSPLMVAAYFWEQGSPQIFNLLINHGARIEDRWVGEYSIAHLCVMRSGTYKYCTQPAKINSLANVGFNFNCLDGAGITPLGLACSRGIAKIASALISGGAKVDPPMLELAPGMVVPATILPNNPLKACLSSAASLEMKRDVFEVLVGNGVRIDLLVLTGKDSAGNILSESMSDWAGEDMRAEVANLQAVRMDQATVSAAGGHDKSRRL